MTTRVLMVCTGNICRSIMAHYVLEQAAEREGLDIVVDSAGISDEERGNPIDRRAARVLKDSGYEVPGHRARQVTAAEIGNWDLILAMTDYHYRSLKRLHEIAGSPETEIKMFRDFDPESRPGDRDVPDPWYGGHQDFVETLDTIERSLPQLMAALKEH